LLGRARRLGYTLTGAPEIQVLLHDRALRPVIDGRVWRVRLPPGTATVRLVSRRWVPAHVRPEETDLRGLGVALSRLWLDRREVSLDSPALWIGWHTPEADWRWTDGSAELAVAGVRELAFELAMTGTYWRTGERRKVQLA
jgi:hypothetical protein